MNKPQFFSHLRYLTRINKTKSLVIVCMLFFSFAFSASAELEELDDKKLEEQTGKEGLTIDLSTKISIGQVLYKFTDDPHAENRHKTLTEPPPRIEYVQGKN